MGEEGGEGGRGEAGGRATVNGPIEEEEREGA